MFNDKLTKCPVCNSEMELGFSGRSSPLSFITSEKLKKFAFRDEDLNKAGLKTILPAKASYDVAYHCQSCKILIVDYGKEISARVAKGHVAAAA